MHEAPATQSSDCTGHRDVRRAPGNDARAGKGIEAGKRAVRVQREHLEFYITMMAAQCIEQAALKAAETEFALKRRPQRSRIRAPI
jgi:hypothetical protein